MVEETHRKSFGNESFTFNAREKDRRAAAGDSGKLRHEDMVLQKQRYVKVIVSGIGFVLFSFYPPVTMQVWILHQIISLILLF